MLEDLKLLLGIAESDTTLDAKLELIITNTTAGLTLLLGGLEIPDGMNFIILEVSVIRYNRIGSEGLTTHNVEGENQVFQSGDFDSFLDLIESYLNGKSKPSRGRARFL